MLAHIQARELLTEVKRLSDPHSKEPQPSNQSGYARFEDMRRMLPELQDNLPEALNVGMLQTQLKKQNTGAQIAQEAQITGESNKHELKAPQNSQNNGVMQHPGAMVVLLNECTFYNHLIARARKTLEELEVSHRCFQVSFSGFRFSYLYQLAYCKAFTAPSENWAVCEETK